MSESNRMYAYFSLVDFSEEPEAISKLIGREPSQTWRKGDLHPASGRERRFSRWSLRSRLPERADLEQHIDDVLEQLMPVASTVHELAGKYNGVIQLVGYFHTHYPGFSLNRGAIDRIAQLGASLDCDFYYRESDNRDDTE